VEEEQEEKEEGSTNNLTDCELGSDTAKRLQQRIIIIIIHGIYGAGLSITVHAMAALLAYMAFHGSTGKTLIQLPTPSLNGRQKTAQMNVVSTTSSWAMQVRT
jgi:hypothetical protein